MPIRLSGLNSGLDTDAIVKELVSAYSLKTEKYEKEQTKIEWKQEAWKNLNTKIYGLYTNVSNLRFDSAYNLKKTSVSNSSIARITASSGAVTGTQKLNVYSMAQACYITGDKIKASKEGEDVTSETKMSELGYTGEDTSFTIKTGDKETEIKITKDTTIKDVITQLKEAGVNASFDENNGRIFVSAKESGAANDFELAANSESGYNVLKALGLNSAEEDVKDQIRQYNGLKSQIALWEKEIEINQKIVDDYDNAKAEQEKRLEAKAALDAIKEKVSKDDFSEEEFMNAIAEGREESYLTDLGVSAEDIESVKNQIGVLQNYDGEANDIVNVSVDTIQGELDKLAENYEKAQEDIETIAAKIEDNRNAMENHKYHDIAELEGEEQAKAIREAAAELSTGAVKIKGQDAEIRLNGVTYTSTTNSFVINGLTIEVSGVTNEKNDGKDEEKAVSITTSTDTQGIYDKIKDFLTEYNNVINEITKLYNAESASDYQPLTDEEKDAMSDEEIEKWENKIKSALLRRDSSLSGIMSAMVNSMAQTVEVNGEKLSLSSFGIQTLGFLNAAKDENYAYHINGDEEDENTSGKEDKLMKAIQENPDQICEFMKKLTSNLYTAIDNKMKSTELSSAYKVYNDKELDSQLTKYKKLISNWEKKVSEQEEAYYKKFSQMEVALSKLQSQTNSLSGLLGQ